MTNRELFLKISVVVTYLGMIGVNALANILPINGLNTGAVSNMYPNLFAPATATFAIWGVIYVFLAGYFVYRLFHINNQLFETVDRYFIASSVANIFWIFSWHYRLIGLSVVIMLVILYSLIKIADHLNSKKLSLIETVFIKMPFSIYFGWITVATIANMTTFLVSVGWEGFGLTDQTWMIIILLVGTTIGLMRMIKDNSAMYGFVFIWAYFGIWLKHTSFFANQYPDVITTVLICIGLFILAEGKICFSNCTLFHSSHS